MRRAPWPALIAVAAVSASSLVIAGFARLESPWHWLGFVCLVPFIAALDRIQRVRMAALLGALMAIGYAFATLGWFPTAIARYTGAPVWSAVVGLGIGALLLQAQFIAWAVVRSVLRRREGSVPWLPALGGALVFVGAEWALPHLFDATLGYGLYPFESLRQAADLAGVRGLTLVLLLANEAVFAATRFRAVQTAALFSPVILASAYGAWRVESWKRAASHDEPVRVGVVQANLTNYGELAERLGTYDAARLILDTHYDLSDRIVREHGADLLIWPETVYPTTFGSPKSEGGAALDDELRGFSARTHVPLLFGTYTQDRGHEYNSAVLLQGGPSAPAQEYRKARPFPLTEYVPPLLDRASIRARLPWLGTWSPGPGAGLLTVTREGRPPLRLLPLICFDVASTGDVAKAARQDVSAIVTLANDAWFAGTDGSRQHLIVAAFRSVETKLPQIRATNSGISAEIDALGRIVRRTDDDRRETLSAELLLRSRPKTLAVRWGDWLGPSALIAAAAMILLSLRRKERKHLAGLLPHRRRVGL